MTFQIITDLSTLDELWRAGILYVSCSPPGKPPDWKLDTQDLAPVSAHVEGWKLLDCGTWKTVYHKGLRDEHVLHNTWAVQVED